MTESKVIEIIRKYLKLVPVCGDDEALDMTLKALTQYQLLEKHLTDIFGPEFSIETVVEEPVNAKILTYEDAKAWEEYKAIGTPEECRAWKEKQTAKKIVRREATDEDIENELREFITRKGMIFQCPTCGCYIAVGGMKNCWDCGQKLDWSDEQ